MLVMVKYFSKLIELAILLNEFNEGVLIDN